MARPEYCVCEHEQPDPCPACGATVEGKDKVNGICQARNMGRRPEPLVYLVLTHRDTGEIVR